METPDLTAPRFTSAEICLAADVARGTFDAWLLRRYLPVPIGPGTGKVRKFSVLDAIRIAVVAEMNRLGIPVSSAADFCVHVQNDYADVRTVMILGPPRKGPTGRRTTDHPTMDIVPLETVRDLDGLLGRGADGQMRGLVIIDLSRIAADTIALLTDPLTKHRADLRTESRWQGATGEKVSVVVPDPSLEDDPEPGAPNG